MRMVKQQGWKNAVKRFKKLGMGAALIAAILWVNLDATPGPQGGSRHHMYLSDKRIVTLELIDAHTVILNYINLSDTIEFLRATQLAVTDVTGRGYAGHLIEVEDPPNPSERYQVSDLIKPKEFKGYSILGAFDFQAPPRQAYVRIGGRTLELEPLTEKEFEIVASRIGELDLDMPDSKTMIQLAGFWRGYGEMHAAASEKAIELESLFPDVDLVPPVLIAKPAPRLPESHRKLPDPVVVSVSANVGRSGGIYNLEVKNGINKRLDEIAVGIVRNSWRILPAISKGEVADSTLVLNVVFTR